MKVRWTVVYLAASRQAAPDPKELAFWAEDDLVQAARTATQVIEALECEGIGSVTALTRV